MMTRRDFREKAETMGWKKVCACSDVAFPLKCISAYRNGQCRTYGLDRREVYLAADCATQSNLNLYFSVVLRCPIFLYSIVPLF